MNIKQIIAPENSKYLKDIFMDNGLPKGIVNKRMCDVGGTTYILESVHPYIITVPLKDLIINKTDTIENKLKLPKEGMCIGIYGGTHTFDDFKSFILGGGYKIMVTFDSLQKIIKWLSDLDIDVYKTFRLLIDEYHTLLSEYSYRNIAIRKVLTEMKKFEYYTLMSATDISPKYFPSELDDLAHYEIVWTNTQQVTPIRIKTTKPYQSAVNIIKRYQATNWNYDLNGTISNEAYFFVNSVSGIKTILKSSNLDDSFVKIICADTPENQKTLGKYKISGINDPNKPITFMTSKCFFGCDFYSDNGLVFIVTNSYDKFTKLDIATTVRQILGRIRTKNNPFRGIFYHIYNCTAEDISQDEYNNLKKSRNAISELNIREYERCKINDDADNTYKSAKYTQLMSLLEKTPSELFLIYNGDLDIFEFDDFKSKNQDFEYANTNQLYKNGVEILKGYTEAGFSLTTQQYQTHNSKIHLLSFKDLMIEYLRLKKDKALIQKLYEIERIDSNIDYFYKNVPAGKMKEFGYSKIKMDNYIKNNVKKEYSIIYKEVCGKLKLNEFYTLKDIKAILKIAYSNLLITETIKATDLKNMFELLETTKKINNKVVGGYILTSPKIKILSP